MAGIPLLLHQGKRSSCVSRTTLRGSEHILKIISLRGVGGSRYTFYPRNSNSGDDQPVVIGIPLTNTVSSRAERVSLLN